MPFPFFLLALPTNAVTFILAVYWLFQSVIYKLNYDHFFPEEINGAFLIHSFEDICCKMKSVRSSTLIFKFLRFFSSTDIFPEAASFAILGGLIRVQSRSDDLRTSHSRCFATRICLPKRLKKSLKNFLPKLQVSFSPP